LVYVYTTGVISVRGGGEGGRGGGPPRGDE